MISSRESHRCDVCGRPSVVRVTEVRHGQQVGRTLCDEHAREEMGSTAYSGPRRTPAEEVAKLRQGLAAFVREQMAAPDREVSDPAWRAAFNAEMERLVADIEGATRRPDGAD